MIRNSRNMAGHPTEKPLSSAVGPQAETVVTRVCIPELPFEEVRIVRRVDGRHVRLSNGRRSRAVGRYASVKLGASVPWESRLELDDVLRSEVDPAVLSYAVQPETLFWQANGSCRRYTPDRFDLMADGSKRCIEIKDYFDPERDPDYSEKLEQAAQIYGALGHAFELRERSEIRHEPQFSAVEEIQAYRRAVVTAEDLGRVREALANGSLPLDAVTASLQRVRARPVLFAMMVRRMISIDLTCGVHHAAPVSLVRGAYPCGA